MCDYFLITGLPRSRTAWMSVLFSDQNVLCFHEHFVNFRNLEDMRTSLFKMKNKHVGLSDSSIPLYWDFYRTLKAKVIIINRDEEAVIQSLALHTKQDIWACSEQVAGLKKGLSQIRNESEVMEVDFNSLNDNLVVQAVWEYALPLKFNKERCDILQTMVVNQDYERVKAKLNKNWKL